MGLILKKKLGQHISSRLLQHSMINLHILDQIQDIAIEQAIAEKCGTLKEDWELKNPVERFAKHTLKI